VLISPDFKPVYGQLGTTFGGNHLACSAALAVLDVMEQEQLVENAREVGDYLMGRIKDLKNEKIKEVRGRGLMIGIELTEEQKPVRERLVYEQHVFTGCSGQNLLRLLPPLTFTKQMADEFIERLQKAL
jgi:acetylornithine aminotransferase